MASLNDDFKELMERIQRGREWTHSSYEPVYYLVFHPSKILDVKRMMPAWAAKLKNHGWKVHLFSIHDTIAEIFDSAPLKMIWVKADKKDPQNWKKTNKSLANALTNGSLQSKLENKLTELSNEKNAILLVTDLEALHPYLRIGVLENNLQGRFSVPTVFFYPGTRAGKTRLKFLGFYPADGNYRSVHVGG